MRKNVPNVLFLPSPPALWAGSRSERFPACRCGRGCRQAVRSAGLGSNGRYGGLSQAVGLRATERACPGEAEVPFCMSARVRQCLAFPVVCCACGVVVFRYPVPWRGGGSVLHVCTREVMSGFFGCVLRLRFSASTFRQNGMEVALSLVQGVTTMANTSMPSSARP